MNKQNKKTQTFIESMTRMFPITVIRLRDPATRVISTISTVVYELREVLSPLLVLVMWDEFSILSLILLTDASESHLFSTW